MKKILFIAPHFVPSHLTGMHRTRLLVKHLRSFGWDPIVLTVHERHYEGKVDQSLTTLLDHHLRIEKVDALPIGPFRIIGDLGLRSFVALYRAARKLIQQEQIDFLFISVPSFYTALLGRLLYHRTSIPYAIDYIDPWVHDFPGSDRLLSRAWWSTQLAHMLEPIAVRKARLITGVDNGYFQPVFDRNPNLKKSTYAEAFPYGWDQHDLQLVQSHHPPTNLSSTIKLIYAGAILPRSYELLEFFFSSLAQHKENLRDFQFHFIGTGIAVNDDYTSLIEHSAKKWGLWNEIVFEKRTRINYGALLGELSSADGVFIIGGTEAHYTPSKLYNAVLMKKPVFALLHHMSSTIDLIQKANMGNVFVVRGAQELPARHHELCNLLLQWKKEYVPFKHADHMQSTFDHLSSFSITKRLSALLEKALMQQN